MNCHLNLINYVSFFLKVFTLKVKSYSLSHIYVYETKAKFCAYSHAYYVFYLCNYIKHKGKKFKS